MTLNEKERQSNQTARKNSTRIYSRFDMKDTVAALFSGFAGHGTTPRTRKEWKVFRLAQDGD